MVQMALPIINSMYKTMEKWQKMWFCHNQMQWFAKDADVYLNKIGILMTWYIVKSIQNRKFRQRAIKLLVNSSNMFH